MDPWIIVAIVIIVGALALDRTRAYRALPVLLNRLRGRSRNAGHLEIPGVDSPELPRGRVRSSEFAGGEEEGRHGEGH